MRVLKHGFDSRPGQTLATFQRNILQHCWAQHVAYVWPPCCDMLRYVATCWMMLDHVGSNLKTVNTFQNLGGYSKVNKNRLSVLNP